jgi:aminodeoxyfutalosine deaminase
VLVHAGWVLPIASDPLRDGAVLVHGDRIVDVGPVDDLVRAHPGEPVERNDGCVLLPGLVNAHTHLALTVLGGLLPTVSFGEWLPLLVRAMRALTPEALEASVALGARRCLEAGVTVVGDIAYGSASVRTARQAGLGGAFFWEVLGIQPDTLEGALADEGYPAPGVDGTPPDPRTRAGISPHSPYTSGPGLLRAAHAFASAERVPYAIHVAESHAEAELFEHGSGALAGTAGRFAMGLAPGSGITSVRYLNDLGVLDGTLAVHCVQLRGDDIDVLAAKTAGVVLCPRSNAYLREGPAPVGALEAAGTRLALGTDSLASNLDLDLLDEARAVRRLVPALTAERVVRMATADGAAALGMGGDFGSLATGYQADLAIFRCAPDEADPYEGLVGCTGRPSLESVMAGGEWRVRQGRALERPGADSDALLERAREAARAALA